MIRKTMLSIVLAMMLCTALGAFPYVRGASASSGSVSSLSLAQASLTVSINNASLIEGNTGTSNMVFTVTLTSVGSHPGIAVSYATADGPPPTGAAAPSDYTNTTGTLAFPPGGGGTTTMTITVPINGDTSVEPNETFFVNLRIVDGPPILINPQGTGTIIDDDGAVCTFGINPTSQAFPPGGGTGNVIVTAPSGCTWIATNNTPWITITSGTVGSGNATVNYSVASNAGEARTGTMTIAGQTFTVEQQAAGSCASITPTSEDFGSGGGSGNVQVMAPETCNWTSASNDSWITITSGANGSGNGVVNYSVAPNPGEQRTGTMTVAGRIFTVTEQAPGGCIFSLESVTRDFTRDGGTGAVPVRAPAGCTWTSTSNAPWISIANSAGGSGDGTVAYSVAPNTGAPRTGTITVAGLTFVVSQEGIEVCNYALNPTEQFFEGGGGSGTLFVTTSPACEWRATSTESWITINSGTNGRGNGLVNYSVEASPLRTQRLGTIIVSGKVVTVYQSACAFSLRSFKTSQDFSAARGSSSLTIDSAAGCGWTAVSNDSWITITSGSSNDGSGTAVYEIAENTGAARTGTITIAGITFTVNQLAPGPCPFELVPESQSIAATNYTGFAVFPSVQVKAALGCEWTAVSNVPWIKIAPGRDRGNGDGTVYYTVDDNTGSGRAGTMTIAGRSFIVFQAAPGNCSARFETTTQNFGRFGGSGRVNVLVPLGCEWTATSNDPWITIDLVTFQFLTYRVERNDNGQRIGAIILNGRDNFVVTQDRCPVSFSPESEIFSYVGGEGTISIDTGACFSRATSEDPSWITITSAGFPAKYRVAQNTGPFRTGGIRVGDRTFTVSQYAGGSCDMTIAPTRRTFTANRLSADFGDNKFTVTTPPNCQWVARTDASWITLESSSSMGPGDVTYSIAVNATPRSRTATITVSFINTTQTFPPQIYTVSQDGTLPPCVEAISPAEQAFDGDPHPPNPFGGHPFFTVNVTTPPDCEWEAVTEAPWIILGTTDDSRHRGSGTFRYRLARNQSGERNGVIDVGGKIHTITQGVGVCPVEVICQLFPSQCNEAPQARSLRDNVLAKTSRGKKYTELYYRFSNEAVGIMMLNPMLILRSREFLERYMPVVESMAKGDQVTLTEGDIDEIDTFLRSFAGKGSRELQETVNGVCQELRETQVQLEFNIRVVTGQKRALPARSGARLISRMSFVSGPLAIFLFCILCVRPVRRNFSRTTLKRLLCLAMILSICAAQASAAGQARLTRSHFTAKPAENRAASPPGRSSQLELGNYDRSRPLTIDPVLAYSTYFGGNGNEEGNSITVDSAGNIYITGFTDSTNFPLTSGSQPAIGGGQQDAFVAKLDPSGKRLLYSTYLGGNGQDNSTGIAVDSAGNAWVTGFTDSADFPVRNALQPTKKGKFNAFVVKLDPAGSILSSTLLGGTSSDYGSSIAVDSAGNAYIAGLATSPDFPLMNALQQRHGGLVDLFVAKIDSSGARLLYSTYLGGSGVEGASSIAVDSAGNVYVTGLTGSRDFRTVNPLQAAHGGGIFDAFVTKLNPSGSQIVYSTYLGGAGEDRAFRIAVDSAGNAYVTGDTDSTNFPATNALQPANKGSSDAFVSKLNPGGSSLVYSTYLGGSGLEGGTAIAVDSRGSAYVTGFTASPDFPTAAPSQQAFAGGGFDAFIVKLNSSGVTEYSTYLGGSGIDSGFGIAVDSARNAYLMGVTASANFPTANPLQQVFGGGTADLFVARIKQTPTITSAHVAGKMLQVVGSGFDEGARILLNGQQQKTMNDAQNPTTALVGPTAGRKIAPGERVTLQVRNSDGTLSNEFSFTRQ